MTPKMRWEKKGLQSQRTAGQAARRKKGRAGRGNGVKGKEGTGEERGERPADVSRIAHLLPCISPLFTHTYFVPATSRCLWVAETEKRPGSRAPGVETLHEQAKLLAGIVSLFAVLQAPPSELTAAGLLCG